MNLEGDCGKPFSTIYLRSTVWLNFFRFEANFLDIFVPSGYSIGCFKKSGEKASFGFLSGFPPTEQFISEPRDEESINEIAAIIARSRDKNRRNNHL